MNLKRVLTPGWLLGIIAVIAFAVACFMLLAPWQLGKNDSLNARNDRLVEASESDPVPVDEALDAEDPASFEWHFVSATGRFDDDPQHQILVRLRPVDGNQVYQVLSPFETDDGRTLLINRGWVPVGAAGAIGDIPPVPSGEVEITARFRQAEPQPAEPTEIRGATSPRSPRFRSSRTSISPRNICSSTAASRARSAKYRRRQSRAGRTCPTASSGSPSVFSHLQRSFTL